MKIVVLDGFALNPGDLDWKPLRELGELIVYDRTEANLITNRISSCDVVLTNKVPITRETLDECPSIKFIGVMATGYNTVDVDYAKEKGIVVSNVPAYSTQAVTQHVFALLFDITNHIHEHAQSVKSGDWQKNSDFSYWKYPLKQISEKKIGIIGMGQIGRSVAKVANAFGMSVLAYTPSPPKDTETELLHYVSLDTLLEESDIISLHCPLNDSTRNLICKETIQKMKPSVILINTSRGQTVNEQDLADALNRGNIAFAALDVLCQEPPKSGSALIENPRCIITPHIAWAPLESRQKCMSILLENVRTFAEGHPQNRIN